MIQIPSGTFVLCSQIMNKKSTAVKEEQMNGTELKRVNQDLNVITAHFSA